MNKVKETYELINRLKYNDQDFEWYPTTNEILETIKIKIKTDYFEEPSILDCGAGDGRSLIYLTEGKRYAIEKSTLLIERMCKSIFIVGTDFTQQTLIDKKVDVVFCNPPYSEYVQWMEKIIKESNACTAFFVVPQRWRDNVNIINCIKKRKATIEVIGSFDFLSADRQARALVDIVCINFYHTNSHYSKKHVRVDPFSLWFDDNFFNDIKKTGDKFEYSSNSKESIKENVNKELVNGGDIVSTLETIYNRELELLMKNYRALEMIDTVLMKEINVSIDNIKEALKIKIEGLKDKIWRELFCHFDKITTRLTCKNRQRKLELLFANTHIDYNASNAYAILIWVIKNTNIYLDDQLVDLVDSMTEQANIKLYKSNKTLFKDEDWKYSRKPEHMIKYHLDKRIVLHRIGGIEYSQWEHERTRYKGLRESAYNFVSDIITVANNLGFDTNMCKKISDYQWLSNVANHFYFIDEESKKEIELMKVRAFKNGNLHISFNQKFICKLNVEFGRLKGWLKNHQEASNELGTKVEESAFNSNFKIERNNLHNILKLNSN